MELAPGDSTSEPSEVCYHRVSILVFVELAPGGENNPILDLTSPSFNPCFCGTRSRREEMMEVVHMRSWVSILVFVELAPGAR